MLSSISWQQYFAVLLLISASYYAFVLLRYYQNDIAVFLKNKKSGQPALPEPETSSFEVMGKAQPEPGVSFSEGDELQFLIEPDGEPSSPETDVAQEEEERSVEQRQHLLGEVTDLITAFHAMDDKPGFLSLLKIQLEPYAAANVSANWTALKKQIIELSKGKLPFKLGIQDLRSIPN
ncbi:hypothetical protein [uncultured Mucilaginibacter sp.]|uniref:hypothetical protein n=1 Tax=uncultured Mucilaginibacter sp. TaxID=797541 RepID=UPI0025D9A4E7|nr:hypothetical protein [uncultured Mucilaginibacter sp.]